MLYRYLLLLFSLSSCLFSSPKEDRQALFYQLAPKDIRKNLAFYQLYPHSKEGKVAFRRAMQALFPHQKDLIDTLLTSLSADGVNSFVNLMFAKGNQSFDQETLHLAQKVSSLSGHLKNRVLPGYQAKNLSAVLSLPSEEVDLARGLLLDQFEGSPSMWETISVYEGILDLMALQVLARLPDSPSPAQKLQALSNFIFYEMEYRFPPYSVHAQEIDTYTFLSSVIDQRRGVCLGVSILYLCLAQRIGLTLEIVTPPGHIYIRLPSPSGVTNVETTARGIHLPSDSYLGINTHKLQTRTIKEVIGLARFNQASVFWQQKDYEKAIQAYKKAELYLGKDPLLQEFLGYMLCFSGNEREGKQYLKSLPPLPDAIYRSPTAHQLLSGDIDIEAVQAAYLMVDETRESILSKQEALKKQLERFPHFLEGWLHLGTTYLQLGQYKNALKAFEEHHRLDSSNPTIEYYLAELKLQRLDLKGAWKHFLQAKKITEAFGHSPKGLKDLFLHLQTYAAMPSAK